MLYKTFKQFILYSSTAAQKYIGFFVKYFVSFLFTHFCIEVKYRYYKSGLYQFIFV